LLPNPNILLNPNHKKISTSKKSSLLHLYKSNKSSNNFQKTTGNLWNKNLKKSRNSMKIFNPKTNNLKNNKIKRQK
jgi:hypothetical protein